MRGFKRFHSNLGIDSQPASMSPVVVAFAIGAVIVVAKTVAAAATAPDAKAPLRSVRREGVLRLVCIIFEG